MLLLAIGHCFAPESAFASSGKARRSREAAVRDLSNFLRAYKVAVSRGAMGEITGFWADDAVVEVDSGSVVSYRQFLAHTLQPLYLGGLPAVIVNSDIRIAAEGLAGTAFATQCFLTSNPDSHKHSYHN